MRRGTCSTRPIGLLAGGLLGASTALLVACGSSGKLIPVANSEPLQKDFEEVARAAESGHGSCASTEAALNKADHDFAALPASVDAGLRRRLGEGLSKLRADALELCLQPLVQATTATAAPRTTTTAPTQPSTTTPTTPATTNTQTTPNTTTTTAPGGGTPAKEGEGEESGGAKPKDKAKEGGAAGGAPGGGQGGK